MDAMYEREGHSSTQQSSCFPTGFVFWQSISRIFSKESVRAMLKLYNQKREQDFLFIYTTTKQGVCVWDLLFRAAYKYELDSTL
jgi:hypothetical protein